MCHRYAYSGLFMKWNTALAAQCLRLVHVDDVVLGISSPRAEA